MTAGVTQASGISAVSYTQSPSAPAIANSATIASNYTATRVSPAGAVTGIILAAGVFPGQLCTVVNEAAAANTITFAAAATSKVADGVSSVIAGLTARTFVWDSSTSLWYPCK
jgi:hypothetical protein